MGDANPQRNTEGTLATVELCCMMRTVNHVKIKVLTIAVFCALFCGCETNRTPATTYTPGGLDEAALLAIARDTVANNDNWVEQAKFQKPKRNDDGTWNVRVTRIPEGPGGHRFIVIDQQGRVTGYFRDREPPRP